MPPEDTMAAAKGGFVTFCSFLFFGCIPLIVYVITAISLGTEKSAEKVRIHPIVLLVYLACTRILVLARKHVRRKCIVHGCPVVCSRQPGTFGQPWGSGLRPLRKAVFWGVPGRLDVRAGGPFHLPRASRPWRSQGRGDERQSLGIVWHPHLYPPGAVDSTQWRNGGRDIVPCRVGHRGGYQKGEWRRRPRSRRRYGSCVVCVLQHDMPCWILTDSAFPRPLQLEAF